MSAYLDDLNLLPGSRVICKADIAGGGFTPGREYTVLPGGQLTDDAGNLVVPSARFLPKPTTQKAAI